MRLGCACLVLGFRATLVLALALLPGCGEPAHNQQKEQNQKNDHDVTADLVIFGGRVYTANPSSPWAEAVAVTGDRITFVGKNDESYSFIGEATRKIDAEGALVVPGFIDTHVHFLSGGFGLSSVQLRDARTPEEFERRIADFAATVPPGTWILNGNWDHEMWGGELPTRTWIDRVTPDHPVWVNRLDGHMALANTAALEAAGIDASTADVAGGEIVRGANGEPTGILKDNAMELVDSIVPPPAAELEDRAVDAAMDYVLAQGVTSLHVQGTWHELEVLERAHDAGRLRARIYACVPLETWRRLSDVVAERGRGDEWLRIGCLKGFVDGSLGSHTAAFLAPFTDTPEDSGFFVTSEADREQWTRGAVEAGLQVNVHAIGDRAIRSQLDVFERVAAGQRADRRWRIEHAQHIHPDDIPRFAELGVIASMQPYHAIDDGRWADKVIGDERSRTTYAFRSLLDAGATLAFGSDWFVAPATPIEGIYAAVTRRTLDGAHPDGWVPEQRITVEEALAAYTRSAAYASFEEGEKGSLDVGKLADIVVLDRDLTAVPASEINGASVRYTIVAGEPAFEAENPGTNEP